MKKILITIIIILSSFYAANAQVFITKGKIEYEVKVNNHKSFGDGMWGEMAKDKFPKFSINYYDLVFNDSKSLYKFNREDAATKLNWGNDEKGSNIWYNDYGTQSFVQQKYVFDGLYLLTDSLTKIKWKLVPNETREIAGFTCRKAVAKLFDSVYVFAFYTEEIVTSGGPMSLHGLPGMILGVTIPRMYTSWIATKLQVVGIDDKVIVPPTKGKKKKAAELKQTLITVTKDWGTWGQQAVWNIFM
jgi:GLPGLI family protein